MAISEAERVALYWSRNAIASLLHKPAVRQAATGEVVRPHGPERIDGGCLLYRLPPGKDKAKAGMVI